MPAIRLLLMLALTCSMVGSAVAVAPAAGARPAPVRTDVQTLPLAHGKPVGDTRELTRKRAFSMVAVRWDDRRPASVEVQTRRVNGAWGAWTTLEPMASAPDGRTPPASTEPLWVSDSNGIRVRSDVDEVDLDVVLIDAGRSAADEQPVTTQAVGKPAVISRSGWGADESIRCMDAEYMPTVKAATIHHTAGTNDYTQADSAAIVRGIYLFHAVTNGWCDIGYNALVDKYGQIFEGAYGGLERAIHGAHAGGFNTSTFGVSMMGLYTDVAPTAAQLESVSWIVAWKLGGSYRNPLAQVTLISAGGGTSRYPAGTAVTLPVIFAHRDVGYTECPGNIGYTRLQTIRDRVAALVGDPTNTPIYRKWQTLGGEQGPVGSPHRVESPAANGGLSTWFDGGAWTPASIYWSAATDAHEVHGAIAQRWMSAALGAEAGLLGYPTTDGTASTDGVGLFNHFQGGSIFWSPTTSAWEVYGPIRARYATLGWERSYLGYPVTGVVPSAVGQRVTFQRGIIELNLSTGVVTDRSLRASWGRTPRAVI